MDYANEQIEDLKIEIALLRGQLARAEKQIAKCQADTAELEKIAKSEVVKMWDRFKNFLDLRDKDYIYVDDQLDYIYKRIREIDGCLWPVLYRLFPKYNADMKRIKTLIGEPAPPPGEPRLRVDKR